MAWRHGGDPSTGCVAETVEQAVGALVVQEYRLGRLEEHPGVKALIETEYLSVVNEVGGLGYGAHLPCMAWVGTRLISPEEEDRGLVQLTELVVETKTRLEEFRE